MWMVMVVTITMMVVMMMMMMMMIIIIIMSIIIIIIRVMMMVMVRMMRRRRRKIFRRMMLSMKRWRKGAKDLKALVGASSQDKSDPSLVVKRRDASSFCEDLSRRSCARSP